MPSLRVPFLPFMLILFANHAVSLHGINLSVIIVRGNRIMIFEVVIGLQPSCSRNYIYSYFYLFGGEI